VKIELFLLLTLGFDAQFTTAQFSL